MSVCVHANVCVWKCALPYSCTLVCLCSWICISYLVTNSLPHICVCLCLSVCWLENRLYGLADYQCLCKCSLSVYSALFVGGIWRRQTAIDQPAKVSNEANPVCPRFSGSSLDEGTCLCVGVFCGPFWDTQRERVKVSMKCAFVFSCFYHFLCKD